MNIAPNIKDGEATEQNNDIDAAFAKHLDIAIEAQDGPSQNTDTETKTGNEAETNADGTAKQPDDSKSSTDDPNAQQQSDKKSEETGQQAHGAKDLKLSDGTVVRGGQERRFFEQRNVAREQAKALETRLDSIQRERNEFEQKFKDLESTVSNLHGADPVKVKIGLNIVNDLQRDPQGTMQKLLAEVIAQGYTIEGIGAGIDTAAITRLIEERLPAKGATEEVSIEKITADATAEANQFFASYPDAKPHDELLARMLGDNPGLDLQSAYFQLKGAFAEKGFDWSRSLEDNVKATSGQTNNENKTADTTNPNNKPLPNGNNGNGTDVVVNRGNISHESEDTGDIVKQAMREAGMNI